MTPATGSATSASFYAARFSRQPTVAELTELGRVLFADISLSASGKLACASCHDPAHAYGPPDGRPVAMGGPNMDLPGVRAIPSLTYGQATPAFDEHFSETEGDDSVDQGPAGGRGWDGRASSAHQQAELPLLSPFEMANEDSAAAINRLRNSRSAAIFRATFGDTVLADEALSWKGMLLALEVFQQSPSDFYPYTSKYDAWLRGAATLSESEQRGLDLFNDPGKGNCAECHPSAIRRGGFPQFTDYGFLALGVPRNPRIPVNANPKYFDLGLCGPYRTDLTAQTSYCGLFKTPSLRNVALRRTFFHNGVFTSLDEVVRFYVTRDLKPEDFFPRKPDGSVAVFNDLPPAFRDNINVEAPFRTSSGAAALSEPEIGDVVNFLKTLTDGFGDQ
jgi:cytochrome c peroxidase